MTSLERGGILCGVGVGEWDKNAKNQAVSSVIGTNLHKEHSIYKKLLPTEEEGKFERHVRCSIICVTNV
jgi:hypothetical protein